MVILGIDPGSVVTGYGLIDNQRERIRYIDSGFLKITGDSLPQKLGQIFQQIETVIRLHRPEHMSIENVFMQKNIASALKLGQARGAAICAGYQAGLEIAEYAPREVKQALVGTGAASKQQVQYMVKRLLVLQKSLQMDESDGLATAICHAQHYAARQKIGKTITIPKRRRQRR